MGKEVETTRSLLLFCLFLYQLIVLYGWQSLIWNVRHQHGGVSSIAPNYYLPFTPFSLYFCIIGSVGLAAFKQHWSHPLPLLPHWPSPLHRDVVWAEPHALHQGRLHSSSPSSDSSSPLSIPMIMNLLYNSLMKLEPIEKNIVIYLYVLFYLDMIHAL